MSLRGYNPLEYAPGFPRVSGDEPPINRAGQISRSFSPRERG